MRLIVFLILFSIASGTHAQYIALPDYKSWNSDSINDNIEGIFGYLYTPVLKYANVTQWSQAQTMPFNFYFDGKLVSHYKFSTTGIVTFDTTVSVPPVTKNISLPDLAIPKNSICLLGCTLKSSSGSDRIPGVYINVLNTQYWHLYPYPQLWITFYNLADSSSSGFSTWSIVLEGNSNKIYVAENSSSITFDPELSIGIQIDSQTAYMMPGSPHIASQPGAYGVFNEAFYCFIPGKQFHADGALIAGCYDFLDKKDAPFHLTTELKNMGLDTIRSLVLNCSINGGNAITQNFAGLNIPCGSKEWFSFYTPWNPDTGSYTIDYWVSKVNGISDESPANNHFDQQIYIAPSLPKRHGIYEEFKGTWCIHSGYWTKRFDSVMAINNNKASSIKYEGLYTVNGFTDPNHFDSRFAFYRVISTPSSYVNGWRINKYPDFYKGCPWQVSQEVIDSSYNLPGLFNITPSLELNGRNATLSAKVKSLVSFPDKKRCILLAAIVADTMQLGHPTGNSGEMLFINTVMRMFPDGKGISIGAPKYGETDSIEFNYIITDTTLNIEQLHLVVFVQDSITREIYQGAEIHPTLICAGKLHTSYHEICYGDSLFYNGGWEKSSNIYPTVFRNKDGCDSVQLDIIRAHTLYLRVYEYNYTIDTSFWYESYHPYKFQWYNNTKHQIIPGATGFQYYPPTPGMYSVMAIDTISNCDTLYSNVVRRSCAPSDTVNLTVAICDGDSINLSGKWYNQPGSYASLNYNKYGCDSVTITQLSLIGVSIRSDHPDVTCPGSTVTFTTSIPPGTLDLHFQWFVNGTVAGTDSSIFSTSALSNGDIITCILSTLNCTAISNAVTVTILNKVSSYINIIATPDSIVCEGTSITFKVQPYGAGATPVYQWKVNGLNKGKSTPEFSYAGLADGDKVSCSMGTSLACSVVVPARSNVIQVKLNAKTLPSITITSSDTDICKGDTITFQATATNTGSNPGYFWNINGPLVIPYNNSNVFKTSLLANGNIISCSLVSNSTCKSSQGGWVNSNSISIKVNSNEPRVDISAVPGPSICSSGTEVTFTAIPKNGGDHPVYKWLVNGLETGTNSPVFTSSSLANKDVVKCIMTSNSKCLSKDMTESNTITMKQDDSVNVFIASNKKIICDGSPVTFTATAINGGAHPDYQWKINSKNTGTNSYTFVTALLKNNDTIGCQVISNAQCISNNPAFAGFALKITPNLPVNISLSVTPGYPICHGTPSVFKASALNGGTHPTFIWKHNNYYLNGYMVNDSIFNDNGFSMLTGDTVKCTMLSNAVCAINNPASDYIIADVGWWTMPSKNLVLHGDTLIASKGYQEYSWFDCSNGMVISGTDDHLIINKGGSYAVTISNGNGCQLTTDCFNIVFTENHHLKESNKFTLSPNPAWDETIINFETNTNNMVEVTDISGRILMQLKTNNHSSLVIPLTDLTSGCYILRVIGEKQLIGSKKLIVIK